MKIVSKRHPDRKPNPITAIARTEINVSAWNLVGGVQALIAWSKQHHEDFKKLVEGLKP